MRRRQSANETGGNSLAGQFFPKPVERSRESMPDQAAPDRTKFVIHPKRNLKALRPRNDLPANKNEITNHRKKTSAEPVPQYIQTSQPGSNLRCSVECNAWLG